MALAAIPNKGRRIRRFPVKAAEAWVEGAILLLDANGELIEAAADPAAILGFAAHAIALAVLDPDPGFALVYVAYPDSTFMMEGVDTTPVATDVGEAREVGIDANGVAIVDTTVVNTRLTVEDIYIKDPGPTGFYEVSVLAANRQFQV